MERINIMTRETRLYRRLLVPALASLTLVAAVQVRADDPAPAASPAPEPPKIDVGGFVDFYYGYNFNKVDPALRTFDVQHNAFSLSLAEVNFTKAVTPESRVGFRTDLDFGKTADLVAAFEPESNGKEIYKHIEQAYVSLLTGKVQWDAGKWVTPLGAEVIESQDNWNYTRSILFGFAIPFYHTGLRATINASPKFTLGLQLVNGWNNSSEINGDKTFGISATWKPTDKVTWIGNYMAGKEGGTDGTATRGIFDTTLTLALTPKFSVMGNFDYGKIGDVKWWGLAAYAKLQAQPNWALVGRYEYLDDTKGGFMTFGTKGQSLTLTSDHKIAGALVTRFEYRMDMTDTEFFSKSDGTKKKSQSTVTAGIVYVFGGKI
jgi:Putative beta-barrel porin-2, OmpL-like. bbp2